MQRYYDIVDYIPYTVPFVPYLFHNWKFLPVGLPGEMFLTINP